MKDLKEKWQQWSGRFDSLEQRERLLIAGAALAFVYCLWEFTFYSGRREARATLEAEQQIALESISRAEAERAVLTGLAQRDPFASLRRELIELQQTAESVDKKLQALSAGLVAATDLPLVLKTVLESRPQVQLLSLQALPVEELALPSAEAQTPVAQASVQESAADKPPVLYRHGVQVVLRSGFAATLDYLAALEQGSWQFYWEQLDYQVKNYPLAEVTLHVYTLSATRGGWDETR